MDAVRPRAPLWAWIGLLWAGYFAFACLGFQALDPADHAVATLWPAAGVGVGALAVAPRRAWPALAPAIVAASVAAQLLFRDAPLWVEVAFGVNSAIQSAVGALALRALAGRGGPRSGALRTVGGLFAAAATASTVGSIGASLIVHLWLELPYAWRPFLNWSLGNAIGILVLTPSVLATLQRDVPGRARWPERLAILALVAVVTALIFERAPGSGPPMLAFGPVVLPFLLLCAVRTGTRTTSFALLLVAVGAGHGTAHGLGPFAVDQFTLPERAQVLLGFLAVAVLTTLVIGAIVADQRQARDDLHTVIEEAPVGHLLLDARGRVLDSNRAFRAITGYEPDALSGAADRIVPDPRDLALLREALVAVRRGHDPTREIEVTMVRADGTPIEVALYLAVLGRRGGDGPSTLIQIVDISARKVLEERLRALAVHDPLTGLLNRRGFDQELALHLSRGRRYGHDGAVVLIDVDHFKRVNDRHGHQAGDELLVAVADVLRRRLRATDRIGRRGGDEFAVLLSAGDHPAVAHVAGALVAAVRDELEVTVSAGVALIGPDGEDAGALIDAADRAMYETKADGRDGLAFAGQAGA
jgi:diguanylate cyclase (GGDEF)-like protein/PAS domain S-box-containing protein